MPDDSPSSRTPLNVWILSDGIPGHMTTARGVLKALGHIRNCDAKWLPISLRWVGLRRILRFCLNRNLPLGHSALRSAFKGFDDLPPGNPDVLIASGGKTSYAAAILARLTGARSLYAGTLRGLKGDLFTATIAPVTSPQSTNHIHLRLPVVDMEWRDDGDTSEDQPRYPAEKVAVLLGGQTKDYAWDAKWRGLGQALNELARSSGCRINLTTSRRTGAKAEDILLSELDPAHYDELIWFRSSSPRQISEILNGSDLAIVTEDSMAMTAEAIMNRRPVIALRPEATSAPSDWRNRMIIDQMSEDQRMLRVALPDLSASTLQQASKSCLPLTTDPIAELADRLRPYF